MTAAGCGGELLPVHAVVRNTELPCGVNDRIDQGPRTTDIQMRGVIQPSYQRLDIEHFAFAVDVQLRALGMWTGHQINAERSMFRAAKRVVKYILRSAGPQLIHLRQKRRNTNPTRNHHVTLRLTIKGKQIVGCGNGQQTADLDLAMHERRTTLGFFFEPHTNLILPGTRTNN